MDRTPASLRTMSISGVFFLTAMLVCGPCVVAAQSTAARAASSPGKFRNTLAGL